LRPVFEHPAASLPRAYDALIAATAVAHDLPLSTANPTDFEGLDRLDVRAVQIDGSP